MILWFSKKPPLISFSFIYEMFKPFFKTMNCSKEKMP